MWEEGVIKRVKQEEAVERQTDIACFLSCGIWIYCVYMWRRKGWEGNRVNMSPMQ